MPLNLDTMRIPGIVGGWHVATARALD